MKKFMAFIEWRVQTNWFELDARTRRDYAQQIHEIISSYPSINFRWFDAEAWTGKFTDFSLCEFDDLDSYNSLWGELKRHPFLSTPFAFASRVVLGMELDASSFSEPTIEHKTVAPTPTVTCPTCGRQLKASAQFCGGCGSVNGHSQRAQPLRASDQKILG